MPRGRAGICYVSPDSVRRVLHAPSRWRRAELVKKAAGYFGVDQRTIRRALERGLALHYGEFAIQPAQWERFAKTLGVSVSLERRGQLYVDPRAPVRAPAPGQVSIDSCPPRIRRGQVSTKGAP